MKANARFWQGVQLIAGLFMLVLCWRTADILLGVLALLSVVLAVSLLLSPSPEERVQAQITLLRQQGIYPQGQVTDEDVRRVLQAGHKILAIRMHRELHNVSLKQAVEEVKKLA